MESDENDLDNLFEEHDTEERGINQEEIAENNEGGTNNANDSQTAERVPVPKRIVKNPRLKFNADRLCGERGIPVLINHFKDVKFKGQGHEVEDLNKLMSTLQHWCHRLFPSMTFGDCLRQIEKLGKKRPVQTCLRKIRLDMPILHSDFVQDEEDENPDNVQEELDVEIPPQDAFDRLLNEMGDNDCTQLASTPLPVKRPAPGQMLGTSFGSTLSEEQRKRMEYNKLLATERRKAKLEAMQSDAAGSSSQNAELFPSIQVPSMQNEDEETGTMDQNSLSVNPNIETLYESSTDGIPLSNSHLHTPQSPSVVTGEAEEMGLDDLIDFVDEDDEPQVIEKNSRESSSFENLNVDKNNKNTEVIDLASRKTSSNVEVVDLEKVDSEMINSVNNKSIEVIDLDNADSNNKISMIDSDNAKSNSMSCKDNLEMISIDSEEESIPPAKRFKKDNVTLQLCDDSSEKDNSDILEMDTDGVHTLSSINIINNSSIYPIESEDVID